uniref:HMG box domain-containing protein n=1 Tax=Romanomermis culicivorax TaxID=13658 RepID=A0A915KFI4_ROMCU
MSQKSNKSENRRSAVAVEEKNNPKIDEAKPPVLRALPEFLQTVDGVESFIQKLKKKSNLKKKSRYAPFGKVSIENVSVEDMRIGYRKLRALCFTNLTLKCELDIIEEHYRKYFDADGKFVDASDRKSLINPDDLPPPKPLNRYILFCNKVRGKILEKHPRLSFEELSFVFGEKWRKLSDEKRKVFDEEAERLKSEYKAKLEKYRAKFPPVEKKQKERKRTVKEPKSASNLLANGKKSKGYTKVKSIDLIESDSDNSDLQEPLPKKSLTLQTKSGTNVVASSSSPTKQLIRAEPMGSIQQILKKSMPRETDFENFSSSSSSSESENTARNTTQLGLQNSKMVKFLETGGKSRFDAKPPRSNSIGSSLSESSDSSGSEEKPIETASIFPTPKNPFESLTQPIKFEKSSSSSGSSSDSDDEKLGKSKDYTKPNMVLPNFATPDFVNRRRKKL